MARPEAPLPDWLVIHGKPLDRFNARGVVHFHSVWSDGLVTTDDLLREAVNARLNAMVFMDHDTIFGAEEARNRAAQLNLDLDVIIGIEGTNDKGKHIGGINISDAIPAFSPTLKFLN